VAQFENQGQRSNEITLILPDIFPIVKNTERMVTQVSHLKVDEFVKSLILLSP